MAALNQYWQYCHWRVLQLTRYHWPLYLSALILALSGWLWLLSMMLSEGSEIVSAAHQQKQPQQSPIQQAQTDLLKFYAILPKQTQTTSILQHIFQLAERYHVALAHGEYRLTPATNVSLICYEILLPVQAEPRDIQRFITSSLQEVRPLTLKTIRFERSNQKDTQVKAQVHFILWLKAS